MNVPLISGAYNITYAECMKRFHNFKISDARISLYFQGLSGHLIVTYMLFGIIGVERSPALTASAPERRVVIEHLREKGQKGSWRTLTKNSGKAMFCRYSYFENMSGDYLLF